MPTNRQCLLRRVRAGISWLNVSQPSSWFRFTPRRRAGGSKSERIEASRIGPCTSAASYSVTAQPLAANWSVKKPVVYQFCPINGRLHSLPCLGAAFRESCIQPGVIEKLSNLLCEFFRLTCRKDQATFFVPDAAGKHRVIRNNQRRARAVCLVDGERHALRVSVAARYDNSISHRHARDYFGIWKHANKSDGTSELEVHYFFGKAVRLASTYKVKLYFVPLFYKQRECVYDVINTFIRNQHANINDSKRSARAGFRRPIVRRVQCREVPGNYSVRVGAHFYERICGRESMVRQNLKSLVAQIMSKQYAKSKALDRSSAERISQKDHRAALLTGSPSKQSDRWQSQYKAIRSGLLDKSHNGLTVEGVRKAGTYRPSAARQDDVVWLVGEACDGRDRLQATRQAHNVIDGIPLSAVGFRSPRRQTFGCLSKVTGKLHDGESSVARSHFYPRLACGPTKGHPCIAGAQVCRSSRVIRASRTDI